ncbi:MAG: hypothetical protein GY722_16130 [bacterium]|nr:hypothetical protein [bacterium]
MRRPTDTAAKDYGADGVDIQTAMISHVQAHPDRTSRPKHILWNGEAVRTSFDVTVPKEGRFRVEFLSEARQPPQGVDVKVENGEILLPRGEGVQTLRTWHDSRYEEVVEYPYTSKAGVLKVWNVYYRSWPDGRITEEKWTGNAGFIVEQEADGRWVFRCSNGPSESPDFSQIVFRISV